MKYAKLEDMVKGWFVGDFTPNLASSTAVEVAIKHYKKGDNEPRHVHKLATEITAVVSGSVEMNGKTYIAGDIILLEPGEASDFKATEDAATVVVKLPSAKDDKYLL